MHSLDYTLTKIPVVRKILRWTNKRRIASYEEKEAARYNANPRDLRNFEKKIFSQNGEDGIVEEIFRRIGTTNKFYVEFGIENGTECNTRHLMENEGWHGLWMDGGEENCRFARTLLKDSRSVVTQAFITAENIESLLQGAATPAELDLLSIDIDGNDYWVWKAVTSYRPRVAILEYNASYPPPENWVMPYKEDHQFDGTNNFGASLAALAELGKEKGYTLIACNRAGVNAFFLRDDLLSDKFLNESTDYFYSSPKFNWFFFGFPKGKGPWMKKRKN